IRPTAGSEQKHAFVSGGRQGQMVGHAATVKTMVQWAYGVKDTEVLSPDSFDAQGYYDFIVNLPERGREAFQKLLKEKFGVTGRMEKREVEILVFRVKNPAAAGIHPTDDPKKESSAIWANTFYKGRNQTVAEMVGALEVYTRRLMTDE